MKIVTGLFCTLYSMLGSASEFCWDPNEVEKYKLNESAVEIVRNLSGTTGQNKEYICIDEEDDWQPIVTSGGGCGGSAACGGNFYIFDKLTNKFELIKPKLDNDDKLGKSNKIKLNESESFVLTENITAAKNVIANKKYTNYKVIKATDMQSGIQSILSNTITNTKDTNELSAKFGKGAFNKKIDSVLIKSWGNKELNIIGVKPMSSMR